MQFATGTSRGNFTRLGVVALMMGAVLGGCDRLFQPPPVAFLSVRLTSGEVQGCHHLLGITYALRNLSDRDISRIAVRFLLYDSDGGQLPIPGGNQFEVSYEGTIERGSEVEICSSLDSAIYFLPQEGLMAEQFRILEIDFADGDEWSDPLGLYIYPYSITLDPGGAP